MPFIYFPSNDFRNDFVDIIIRQVEQVSNDIGKEMNVEITTGARVIMMNLLEAIINDPSNQWSDSKREREIVLNDKLGSLHKDLETMINIYEYKKVTTFDLIHWLADNLNNICPIKKRR
ncbi:MAG: hypothetical protein J0M37_13285 [Ignavibacteria bacterium]|nr:hypothetical protein [Ignavibacteria bacterium]